MARDGSLARCVARITNHRSRDVRCGRQAVCQIWKQNLDRMSEFETFLKKHEKLFPSQEKPLEFRLNFGRIGGELFAMVLGKGSSSVTAYFSNTSGALF